MDTQYQFVGVSSAPQFTVLRLLSVIELTHFRLLQYQEESLGFCHMCFGGGYLDDDFWKAAQVGAFPSVSLVRS